MADIDKIIHDLQQKVIEKENELIEAKKAVNSVCKMYERDEIYQITDQAKPRYSQLGGDEYYGRPLATVITEILEKRKAVGAGPAKAKEIYDQMKDGGYQFRTKIDEHAIRGIRISMAKNQKFHQLPSGKFGLKKWYPAAKEPKEATNNKKEKTENEQKN